MPNAYFRAKSEWEHGQAQAGFTRLHDHLKAALGCEVFLVPEHWFSGDATLFESALFNWLTATMPMSAQTILQAPLGRVMTALWALDPSDSTLLPLRQYDFFQAPSSGTIDVEEYAPPANHDGDLAVLVEALGVSAEGGLLGGEHTFAQPGRAILTLAEIDEVPDRCWGPLKGRLRERLAKAYAMAPKDPWPALVERDTLGVLERFLHHLFARNQSPIPAALVTWKLVAEHHPSYAAAATTALERVLHGGKSRLLDELVQIDAGRLHVTDGGAWLRELASGLARKDFSALT